MIQTKYLIIAGAIICLIILYYFYDEIKNIKKLFTPAYQKTMALEAKVMELEKITEDLASQRQPKKRNDSPALSITYHSDMAKKTGNLSVKYVDISETEAKQLLKNIDHPGKQGMSTRRLSGGNTATILPSDKKIVSPEKTVDTEKTKISQIVSEELSEFNKKNNDQAKSQNEETDTIDFKISDLIKNKTTDADIVEYQKILSELPNKIPYNEDTIDNQIEINEDVMKHISESIQHGDFPSEKMVSDIPQKKKSSKNKKTCGKKKNSTK